MHHTIKFLNNINFFPIDQQKVLVCLKITKTGLILLGTERNRLDALVFKIINILSISQPNIIKVVSKFKIKV